MLKKPQLILTALLMFCSLYAFDAEAAIINANSCSKADVTTAYNSASSGDTISVPYGDCSWTSTLLINKDNITIKGAGIDTTYIRLGSSFAGPAIRIYANKVRITGFTFDCNHYDTGNKGIIQVGKYTTEACGTAWKISDFRIYTNKFVKCSVDENNGSISHNAIVTAGYTYGLIDNNVFTNCNGECLALASDGKYGLNRSTAPGGYDNGTIYVEDNTWNYTGTPTRTNMENIVDSNSASRWVFRYNTINIGATSCITGVFSNHETCATGICDGATQGDAGSLVSEIYNNTVNNNATDGLGVRAFFSHRGGRAYVYNNTVTGHKAYQFVELSNLRSMDYGYHGGDCGGAAHARGYSEWCHDADGGYTVEGKTANKTTLNGTVGTTGNVVMASVAGFPTYGGSIIIGTEQIDYTGISTTTLTGCTRGANGTTAAAHTSGAAVDLLIFGNCLEQINNTWVWGNKTVNNADDNRVSLDYDTEVTSGHRNYTSYDIKSYAQRPNNWQYRNDGTAYSYTPYPYPHPLRIISAPSNLSIVK